MDLASISHELGHAIDYKHKISENKELVDIYNEEMKTFASEYTEPVQNIIEYFSHQGGGEYNTGLNEFIAETNMLMKTYGNDSEITKARAIFLVRYFPKTVSKIVEILSKGEIE